MNIIICGLKGTGKTTLCKEVERELGFTYINDYTICDDLLNKYSLLSFIENRDNYVIDMHYSLTPKKLKKLNNCITYVLGFASVSEDKLLEAFNSKNENVTPKQIKRKIKLSLKFKKQCEKHGVTFVDINRDRNEIINQLLTEIASKVKEPKV